MSDLSCTARDIEGLRCYLPRGHAGSHMSDSGREKWIFSIDHGPLTPTRLSERDRAYGLNPQEKKP